MLENVKLRTVLEKVMKNFSIHLKAFFELDLFESSTGFKLCSMTLIQYVRV